MTMASEHVLQILAVSSFIALVAGHGMMIDPASRNTCWRYGFPNPKQYTDNELNCGGYSIQWETNKGKCGVCGDAYHRKPPLYAHPGKYANGIITKTYTKGQQITIKIKITSNHRGFFTFRIGDIGTPPITQEKLTHVLEQPNGATSWELSQNGNGVFPIDLVLPRDLTCDHCVIQWWWKTGNSWGCDENGCGVGHGEKQETFVNCADVKILSDGSPPEPPTEAPTEGPPGPSTDSPTEPPTEPPTNPPTKPPTKPPQPGGCKATGPWTGDTNMDRWCIANCAAGYCPASHCKCD